MLSTAVLSRLGALPWRGNVRELENMMHRAVLLAGEAEISLDVLEGPTSPTTGAEPLVSTSSFVARRMEEVERELILQTLSHTLGNRTHAAVILGISIRTLRNKLRDYMQAGVTVPAALGTNQATATSANIAA